MVTENIPELYIEVVKPHIKPHMLPNQKSLEPTSILQIEIVIKGKPYFLTGRRSELLFLSKIINNHFDKTIKTLGDYT